MPRRFFRKFAVKREQLRARWYLSPIAHLLHDPDLWGVRRRSVVPAFALGIFVAFLPFPGHMLTAALLAVALRVNIPVAAVTTLITNPVSMGPLFYFNYKFGSALLGREPRPFEFEMTFDWLIGQFVYIWEPLLLGCVLLGALSALAGFVALDLVWRASISGYLKKRRARKQPADPDED